MSPLSEDVRAELVVDDGLPGRRHRTILRLCWRPDDALAVHLRVVAEPAHPSLPQGSWAVLRDFLRYGLETATGDGDVRIGPDGDAVVLALRGTCRPCRLRLPAATLRGFLDETERRVPAGEERSAEALEMLIERLMRR